MPNMPKTWGKPALGPVALLARIVIGGALSAALCAAPGAGCKDGQAPAPGPLAMDAQEHERWEIALVEMRIKKNEEFAAAATSPLPAASLAGFEGLNYYFPEPALRFQTPFLAEAGGDTVRLVKRRGQEVPYIRRGSVRFRHEGRDHTLTIFGPAGPADSGAGDYLWLPFYDAASGGECYAGGRYLDIVVDGQGLVDLDFNYAYNPLCDYNPDQFNCTLPPAENRLPFAVQAGEKSFHAEAVLP